MRREQTLRLLNSVRKRELEIAGKQLLDVLSLDVLSLLYLNNTQDVNTSKSRSMSSCHILIQGLNGLSSAQCSVFLVHVVSSRSRIISDPDTKVLDLCGSFLVDLINRNDFTVCLLDSSQSSQEVPESRLGHYSIRGEDSHSVKFWFWFDLRRQPSADNLIFIKSSHLLVFSISNDNKV